MDILSIVLTGFIALELLNVLLLYLKPGSSRGNALGFFEAYEKSKADPEIHGLIRYLINWVAGTKLIFIVLLIGIIIAGDATVKVFSIIALIFSISTFFSRLYPALKEMDKAGQIHPRGYSRTLAIMIALFIAIFTIAVLIYIIRG
jgi:hypothetical protein